MAICPNCSNSIKPDAARCERCDADFGSGSAWKPILAPGEYATHVDVAPPSAKTSPTKKGLLWIVGVIAAVIIGKTIGNMVAQPIKTREAKAPSIEQIESMLQQLADEMKKSVPMKIDEMTVLVNTFANKREFIYVYEVAQPVVLNTQFQQAVFSRVCNDSRMKGFFQNGVSVIYEYHFNQSKLGGVLVTPRECGY